MNSSYGKSGDKTGSINAFNYDLGLGSGRGGKPLNDRRTQMPSYSSTPSWTPSQPNKPAWTHKPAVPAPGSLSGPTSMVGDIFGKTWNSSAPSNSGTGIVNSNNPNLFGDLLGSAMGQSKSSSNVPLKNTAPTVTPNGFSVGSVADSLPKTGNSGRTWGTNVSNGGGSVNSSGTYKKSSSSNIGEGNVNLGGYINRSPNLGGPSMKSMRGSGAIGGVAGMGSSKDPFGSLVDFRSKPMSGMSSAMKQSDKSGLGNDPFRAFQSSTSKENGSNSTFNDDPFQSNTSKAHGLNSTLNDDPFGGFGFPSSQTNPFKASSNKAAAFPSAVSADPLGEFGFPSNQNTFKASGPAPAPAFSSGVSSNPLGDFGFPSSQPCNQTQSSMQSSGGNHFDALFSSAGVGGATEGDDWGMDLDFDGGNDAGGTTELDGLPPPPSGVSAPTAKSKGMDNYKQGQFADAIKWLSWAVILLEKAGSKDGATEVLTCRASCYKEVGEYKKAVADCTKVLEQDGKNVSVLVQRALLYESMEKYKLGAEDLRAVMKMDPGNRVARSTIHRLNKMAE